MDKLSEHVKRSMLSYPSLFPTRIKVLSHLFLVLGNGYDWSGGVLVDVCGSPREVPEGEIYYSDLDRSLEKYYSGPDFEPGGSLFSLRVDKEASNLAERIERGARFVIIDTLASTIDPEARCEGHYELPHNIMSYIRSGYCLGKVPLKIEPSYARGIVEVVEAALRSYPNDSGSADLKEWLFEFASLRGIKSPDFPYRVEPGKQSAALHAQVREAGLQPSQGIIFREKDGYVVVIKNGKSVYRDSEYRGAAQWAQNRYGLSDAELFAMYDDYKADYDKQMSE